MNRLGLAVTGLLAGAIVAGCTAEGDTTDPGPQCGDGLVSPSEICDSAELDGRSCVTEGYAAGQLACNSVCQLDVGGCCNHECVNVGDTSCINDAVVSCKMSAAGCRTWIQETDCKANNGTCDTTSGAAVCKTPTCTDACGVLNATQCNGTTLETCSTGANGCKEWSATTNCADKGQACESVGGVPQCSGTCSDQCKAGALQCSGNVLQECKDSAGCLQWVTKEDCAASNGACVDASGTAACQSGCTNQCQKDGLQICMSNAVHTCAKASNGCLAFTKTQDCTTTNLLCKLGAGGTAKCEGVCLNPCTTVGAKQCNANVVEECVASGNGCQEWKVTTTCPLGQACDATGGQYQCVQATPTGEDCGHVVVVKKGANTINWTATTNNYLSTTPACSWADVDGPDLVLVYQPTFTGTVDFAFEKPVDNRWVAVVASGSCGNLSSQLSCVSEYGGTTMGDSFPVTSGSTYFFYVADTNSGSAPLSNPLKLQLTEIDCSTFTASITTSLPANGATTTTLKPKLQVTFDTAIDTTAGTVTLTGDKGTSESYAVASASEISFSSDDKTLYIEPTKTFPAGESVTVAWTGLKDAKCSKAVSAANWSFKIVTPPCAPGSGGMVGTSVSKLPTGVTYASPYYVQVDQSPTGWIYFGGSSSLYRMKKSGGTAEEITSLAGLSSSNLGYDLVLNGNDIFTIESKSSGTNGYVWRISQDAGQTFALTDMATFPSVPLDSFDTANIYKGKIYLVTNEGSYSGEDTQVWSVPATGSAPLTATLEATVTGESYCMGIAVDDQSFYLTCGTNDRLIRVNRSTKAVALITDSWDLSSTQNYMHAKDSNNDGVADFLYFKAGDDEVYFVCNPATTPYSDVLVSYGTGYGDYGLGFDSVANKLYAWSDTNDEVVVIQ